MYFRAFFLFCLLIPDPLHLSWDRIRDSTNCHRPPTYMYREPRLPNAALGMETTFTRGEVSCIAGPITGRDGSQAPQDGWKWVVVPARCGRRRAGAGRCRCRSPEAKAKPIAHPGRTEGTDCPVTSHFNVTRMLAPCRRAALSRPRPFAPTWH